MKTSDRGMTLIEVMVVLVTGLVVGAMAFHLMLSSSKGAHRGISISSREDRLRLLVRSLDSDLACRCPTPRTAKLEVGSPAPDSATQTLLRTEVLYQTDKDTVEVRELTYELADESPGHEIRSLRRILDPYLEPGASAAAETQTLLWFGRGEQLTWSATPETLAPGVAGIRLGVELLDEQFKDRPVSSEIHLVGGAP
jgi:prepilin-type N-terminal cleavage/methylation domain-containing protein